MFKGEKSVTDLAVRLFHIHGRGAQAAAGRAADALLKANPQLKKLSEVPDGSLIVIPDAAPPLPPEEEVTSFASVRSSIARNVQAAFDSLQQRLGDIETSALDRIKSGTGRFQTKEAAKEMKTALKTAADAGFVLPYAPPSLDSVAKDVKEMSKDVRAMQSARKQVRTKLSAALTSFAK
jgi:hypothetical protein